MLEAVCNQCGQKRISGGFNLGDTSRILAVADPDLVNFSDAQPSEFGESGLDAWKARLQNLFERFTAKLVVIVIEIRLQGDIAYDYGWHDLTLTPKDGGQSIHRRDRYVDIWRRHKEGNWKLWKIGRASCRERVEMSVGGGELKRKKEDNGG